MNFVIEKAKPLGTTFILLFPLIPHQICNNLIPYWKNESNSHTIKTLIGARSNIIYLLGEIEL
jgi:hypothetical protein